MDFSLTKEQQDIKMAAREFAEGELGPVAQECDEKEELPRDLLEKARELGFVGAYIPEAYGGPGADPFGGDMPIGLDPDGIGEHVVRAVAAGSFYILTHHCVRYMVVERYEELLAAFDAQTSADDGTDAIDTRKLMADMTPTW